MQRTFKIFKINQLSTDTLQTITNINVTIYALKLSNDMLGLALQYSRYGSDATYNGIYMESITQSKHSQVKREKEQAIQKATLQLGKWISKRVSSTHRQRVGEGVCRLYWQWIHFRSLCRQCNSVHVSFGLTTHASDMTT